MGIAPSTDTDTNSSHEEENSPHGAASVVDPPEAPFSGLFIDDLETEKSAKKLKRFLKETDQRLGMLLELMPIGLVLHQEQSIIFANQAVSTLVGLPTEELIGRHCLDFIDGDDDADLFERFSKVFSNNEAFNQTDLILTDPNGRQRSIQLIVSLMPWNETPLAQVIIQDVSKIKTMERELHKQSQELASALFAETRARQAQKEFVSVISHEFRTPLAIIDGGAQMINRLSKAGQPEKVQEKTKKIRRAVTRMNGLIDDILASSALEKSGFHITRADFNLKEYLLEHCNQLSEASDSHTIDCDIEALPKSFYADRKACGHIFSNLLSNAIKYSPNADKIKVRGWRDGNKIYIAVQDYGVGIPQAEHGKLFGKYFRASTSRGISGTGIGLNLVKNLLRLQDGDISLKSKVGEGSIFTVHLPIIKRNAA